MSSLHTRLTLECPWSHELEVKHSHFVAWAAPVASPEEALAYVQTVRDPQATHNCWAYRAGPQYRFSDDGEPSGTAGRPILSAIEGQGLDGVVVVVTRYFGGIKLGAGGLVRAYGSAASECLRQAPKRVMVPRVRCALQAPFEFSNTLFHLLEGLHRESETYNQAGLSVVFTLDENQLPLFQEQVRDQTRGRAVLRVLERLEGY
ncbi:YigZ family protein [Meiothermus sp. CFH 77666]|uniref:IMPACT family protein n=1 Tax=Meiothermus sp. CFH 77666 TaxID=2817942 RepID=UPI001AA07FEB|nr:YigZ family protein [Meiothermus sp. CFH 77666]MBO1437058.1 YigZ family protein [Meiothermus sp. CFH 77666]